VQQGKLQLLLNKFKATDEVKVTFFRRNLLKETNMELSSRPTEKLKLTHMTDATDIQKKMYEKWIGVDWPKE